MQLFERLKPRLVIGDHRYTVFTSTEAARVPLVAITNAFFTRYSSLAIGAPKALFPIYHRYPRLSLLHPLVAPLVGPFIPRIIRRVSALHCVPYDVVRRELGLRPLRDLFDFYSGDEVLLPDWPDICPTKGLPENYRYVGTFGWSPTGPLPDSLAGRRDLVYITLGSTARTADFVKLLGGLRGLGGRQVVVTTGPSVKREELGALPGNVRVERFLPGAEVLKRSALAVHHGGMGILGQCLEAGVPMVCVPGNIEQEVIARQFVTRQGLGLVVERYRLTPGKVEGAMRRVLEQPSFGRRAADFAKRYERTDALGAAAARVAELAGNRDFVEAVRQGAWERR
jgi:UDP:flavonoid glycosyltransferase YjiC (YdhE family)